MKWGDILATYKVTETYRNVSVLINTGEKDKKGNTIYRKVTMRNVNLAASDKKLNDLTVKLAKLCTNNTSDTIRLEGYKAYITKK